MNVKWEREGGVRLRGPMTLPSESSRSTDRKVVAVVSFSRKRPHGDGNQPLATPVVLAMRTVAESPFVVPVQDGDTVVVCSNSGPEDVTFPDGGMGILLSSAVNRPAYEGASGDCRTLLHAFRTYGTKTLTGLAPPFGACLRADDSAPTWLATDVAGLFHLYWTQGRGWAAASNSSVLLARLRGAQFDEEGLGAFSLLGHHLGDRTPFADVRKVPAGMACRLIEGDAACVAYGEDDADSSPPLCGRVAARTGAVALAKSVDACIQAHPDAGLELSGGLDSRGVLAAIPASARRGMPAFTIGAPGSADLAVGAHLARRDGLEHDVVDPTTLARLDPEETRALVHRASTARDHAANPLAAGVLEWIESQLPRIPHLTGQNGEYGRGFYYPGQRNHASVDDRLVERLARWRLFTNEQVDHRLLSAAFHEHAREWTLNHLRKAFRTYGRPWLEATDEYYVRERMQRWAGTSFSATASSRAIAAPYFHETYLQWVRHTAPTERRGSRLFAQVVGCLDPGLAAIPLETGLRPSDIAGSTVRARTQRASKVSQKATRKVAQRLRGSERPATGAATLAASVVQAWRRDETILAGVAQLPFLDEEAVIRVATGQLPVNTTSVAFLTLLSAALEDLETSS